MEKRKVKAIRKRRRQTIKRFFRILKDRWNEMAKSPSESFDRMPLNVLNQGML